MTTQYIFLPPLGAVPIYATPADLPTSAQIGEIVSVISDGTVRQWNGSVWNSIGGLASVTDTNSIDLTNTSGAVSADLKLSSAAAGAGNDKLTLSIETDGLLAQTVSKVPLTRTVSTTAPLAGGGDLSANRTLSISLADTATDGYLSSTDWNTFNNKVSTTRTISTTAPLTGGGDLSANRTLSIPVATTSADGYLSSTDWNTFNNKQQAITVTSVGAGNANGLVLSAGNLNLHAATTVNPGIVTISSQTFSGNKVFNGNLLKGSNTTNATFVGLISPSSAGAVAADLQSATVTLGGSNGYTFSVEMTTGESMLLQATFATDRITSFSDPSEIFLTSDAGTGIFVSKSAASNVITIKNRMGGTRTISVVFFSDTITSATVWA
jgi:hypothetical protein